MPQLEPQEYTSRRELALASLVEKLPGEMVPANLDTTLVLEPLSRKALLAALRASGCPHPSEHLSKDESVASVVVWLGLMAAMDPTKHKA